MMSDYKLNRRDRDGAMISLGFGLMMPVPASRLSLRTELRPRRDFADKAYTDYLLSIGIKLPVSFSYMGKPARPPLPDGTPHPESATQPYGWQRDSDGDGVPEDGGADRNRTDDLLGAIQALSQLSYGPI
jgi:hypothetical protein